MGYYMRYITIAQDIVTLEDLETALKAANQTYAVVPDPVNDLAGDMFFGETLLGEIEINRPDDGIFEEDIGDLKDLVRFSKSQNQQQVLDILNKATTIIAVKALWKGTDAEAVLSRIDPMWNWLFSTHPGLLQADNDGFYDRSGLLLEIDLKI